MSLHGGERSSRAMCRVRPLGTPFSVIRGSDLTAFGAGCGPKYVLHVERARRYTPAEAI